MAGKVSQRPVTHAVLVDRCPDPGLAEAVERQATVHGAVPVVVGVLIDAPTDPGLLQHLGYRCPAECISPVAVAWFGPGAGGRAAAVIGFSCLGGGIAPAPALHRVEVAARPEHDAVRLGA
ncbi:hypothetical protein D9M71_290610 [compost metagenome]